MKKTTEPYRGCVGSIEWDADEQECHGKIISGMRKGDLIDYWSRNHNDIQHEFEDAVDYYFDFLEELKGTRKKGIHISWWSGY